MSSSSSSPSSSSSSSSCSTPWEVLLLLSQYLDPKSLAMASCVSKSWSLSMSSDHLWKPLFLTHYPSLSSLRLIDPAISYRRLVSLGYAASNRRHRTPSKPHISLSDLLFTIDVYHDNSLVLSLAKSGNELDRLDGGELRSRLFQFDVEVGDAAAEVPKSGEGLTVAWTAVLKGWRGVLSMIDCRGSGKLVGGSERWFSDELPAPGCCGGMSRGAMGVVAEMGLGFCGGVEGKMKVEKVSMGLRSVWNWRYVSVEEGLRYLQHFLLPSNV